MSLPVGARLGPYEILGAIGAGGMGEVYKARDCRLDRSVAIKILAPHVAGDPGLRARFEREARAVATLDHPHICGLYDVGETDGTHYLVMPFLEGQTLAARLAQGALPLDQALTIAVEIADALDKAHRHGIVHRDVKPGNVMLTRAGSKLLDFGLAKLRVGSGPVSFSGMAGLMTTVPGTERGTILGTVQYMAPEQVEGKDADARTDVWALGTVIYEMVTGERPFQGATPASIIGSILKDQTPPVSTRQPLAPRTLDHLVQVCLAKDPDRRWQSAADVGRELEWIAQGEAASAASSGSPTRKWVAVAGWVVAAALLLAWGVDVWRSRVAEPSATALAPVTFKITPPPGLVLAGSSASVPAPQLAVSPDGRHLVFVAGRPSEKPSLWLRTFAELDSRELPDTENADVPFWSPDSQSVAFFANGVLKKRQIFTTAPAEVVTAATVDVRGAAWSSSGTILYAPAGNVGLHKVPATAGTPEPLNIRGASEAFRTARWPHFLPDRAAFIFQIRSYDAASRGIYVSTLDGSEPVQLIAGDFGAQYASGQLLYLSGSTLMAQPFDPVSQRLSGVPVLVAQPVAAATTGHPAFSGSATGVLAYSAGLSPPTELRWLDRQGQAGQVVAEAGDYVDFRLSRDNKKLAFSRTRQQFHAPDVWVRELDRGTEARITSDPLTEAAPQWSPTGDQLVFRTNRSAANFEFFRTPPDPGAQQMRIWSSDEQRRAHGSSPGNVLSTDWSPDGKYIVYHVASVTTGYDLWALPLAGERKPVPLADGLYNEILGEVSPDGRWIAYTSDESGRYEIYVQSFPERSAAPKKTVSTGGGTQPRWSEDGNELFYLRPGDTLMAVGVRTKPSFSIDSVKALFKMPQPITMSPYRMDYVPAADGNRFVMKVPVPGAPPPSITVVVNWLSTLRGK